MARDRHPFAIDVAAGIRVFERGADELDVLTEPVDEKIPRSLVARIGREDDDPEVIRHGKRVADSEPGAARAVEHQGERRRYFRCIALRYKQNAVAVRSEFQWLLADASRLSGD